MRTAAELLEALVRRGFAIRAVDGELEIRAPRGTLGEDLRRDIRRLKADLLAALGEAPRGNLGRPMEFSLFFFSDDEAAAPGDRYHLLLECARRADRGGLAGIWTPERHFHPLGGLYPNPATLAAALAMVTERLKLRAGSVVLPLHDPLRIAEEWSVVDNLSGGRVEVAFASGWHVDDFALAPERYADRRQRTLEGIETVRRLWRGDPLERPGGAGGPLQLRTRPRPVQPELPVYLTAVGNPETYREAGRLGAGLLTCLLTQEVEELGARLERYRAGLAEAGHGPEVGRVVVFLHTYLGEDLDEVRARVRGPFTAYLARTLELVSNIGRSAGSNLRPDQLPAEDRATLLDFAFERYFERRTLLGTPGTARAMVGRLAALGVDEVACLVDFGLPDEDVLAGLAPLIELAQAPGPAADRDRMELP